MRLAPHARNLARFLTGGRHARRELLRIYYFRLSRSLTPLLLAEAGDMSFLVSTRDDVIGRGLFASGSFDLGPMQDIMRELRARVPVQLERGLFLDIGANIGTTSVAAVVRFGMQQVIAVEPDPENHRVLELNLRLNGLAGLSTAYRCAVSDSEGELQLLRSKENSGDHRAAPNNFVLQQSDELVTVPCTTLDALLASAEVDPADIAVVWIDAQGHEGHILAGAASLLAKRPPIVLEFWPEALKASGGLERLLGIVRSEFHTIIDMGSPYAADRRRARKLPSSAIDRLVADYPGEQFTDLILLG